MKKEVAKIINEFISVKTIISKQEFRRFLSNFLRNNNNYYLLLMNLYAKDILFNRN